MNRFYKILFNGYVFLDKSDSHNIKKIGLYLPRQNLISEWEIEDVIKNYSKFKSTKEAKDNFLDLMNILNVMNKKMK